MLLDIVLLLIGFVVLIYGADMLVKGGSALAAKLNVPNMVIGLTIVAVGTSAPELVVNLVSSLKGQSALAFGNVVGSNIFNIMGVLGVTAIIYPIAIKSNTVRYEIPMVFLSAIIILVMFGNHYWDTPQTFIISRFEGIMLLVFFALFMAYTIRMGLKGNSQSDEVEIKNYSLLISILLIIAGLAGLIIGGRLLVDNAVSIAEKLGVSQRIIAITIVSIGTSLPELATSVVAARRKNIDMAVGNAIGSCLFNVFFILGISAVVLPVSVTWDSIADILVYIMSSLLLFLFIFTGKGRKIERWEGILFVTAYIGYIIYLIFN